MCPLALHIGPYGDVLRTSGRFLGTSSGRPWNVMKSLSNTEAELKKGLLIKSVDITWGVMTVQPDTDLPTFSYSSPRGLTKVCLLEGTRLHEIASLE